MQSSINRKIRWSVLLALAASFTLVGCKRETITSYEVPKEDYTPHLAAAPAMDSGKTAASTPRVAWELPRGWEEKSGEQMRVGSFQIPGEDGKSAEVRIIPLRGVSGIEGQSVNMWRQELGFQPSTNEAPAAQVEVAGLKANFYDLTSEDPRFQNKFKARTLAAILSREGTLWFIKMSGEESVVSKNQDSFRAFLKSLSFHDEEAASTAEDSSISPGGPSKANWKVPATWTEQPAGQMVLAAYTTKASGGANADITVTAFPGDVGGLLANVNRWRNQIKLQPIAESDLPTSVKSVDLSDGSKASLVDVTGASAKTGKAARLYGLIVPRGGKTWFYKMLGDSEAVAGETAHLAEFAGTAF